MSDLVISKMTEVGNQIRAITIPGSGTWYVAKDIADVLGYTNPNQAIRTNCENAVRLCDMLDTLQTSGTVVSSVVFNEIKELTKDWHPASLLIQRPDVHRLIIAAKRNKEEAAQFEKWIFEEVLEEVFDKGSYKLGQTYNIKKICDIINTPKIEVKSENVYIVEFDTGIIKVGKSRNTASRIKRHSDEAKKYGVSITKSYTKNNSSILESDLIQFCKLNSTVYYGNEYFKDLNFDSVVNFLKGDLNV